MQKSVPLLFFFLSVNFSAIASNYYWINGTGHWSDLNHWATTSGGSTLHTALPDSTDDVFFDANSFSSAGDTVNIENINRKCRTLNFTGSNNPVISGTGQMNIYGSFIIHGNVDWEILRINFNSNASGNIIDFSGANLFMNAGNAPQIYFNGNGTWDFQSDISVYDTTGHGGEIWILNGIVNSNNYLMRYTRFTCSGGQFNLGTSQVECWTWYGNGVDADSAVIISDSYINGGSNQYYNHVEAEYVYGDSSIFNFVIAERVAGDQNQYLNVTLQSDNAQIDGEGNQFQKISVSAPRLSLSGNHNYDSLIVSPGSVVSISDSQSVNNLLQFDGDCNGMTEIRGSFNAEIHMSFGPVTLNNLLLADITFSGTTFTANNSVQLSNVTGITINSPASRNLFWVGGEGNWNDVSHWSNSSGGAPGACIPTLVDNVYFDGNSFSSPGDSIILSQTNNYCRNLNFTGANNPWITGNSDLTISGSFIAPTIIRSKLNGTFILETDSTGNLIDAVGLKVDTMAFHKFRFRGTGSWYLQSDLIIDTMVQCCPIFSLDDGSLYTNGYTLKCRQLQLFGGEIHLGTSVINVNYVNHVFSNDPCIVYADNSTINANINFNGGIGNTYYNVNSPEINCDSCNFNNVEAEELSTTGCFYNNAILSGTWNQISQAGNSFGKLTVATPGLECNHTNTFDSLIIDIGGEVFLADTIFIINHLSVNGTCANPVTLIGPSQAFVYIGGTVSMNYANLYLMIFFNNSFTANNSFDLGGSFGVIINNPIPQNLYWVGGSGSWSDSSHWSSTSGGPGGFCVPTPTSNVFFDANSFSSANDTVKVFATHTVCGDMNLTGANQPVLEFYYDLNIYGSLIAPTPVDLRFIGTDIFIRATANSVINTAGARFDTATYPNLNLWSGHMIDLQSDLWLDTVDQTGGHIRVDYGSKFRSNGHTISCSSIGSFNDSIYFDTSIVYLDGLNRSNLFWLDADSSTIIITMGSLIGSDNDVYHNVNATSITCDSCSFDNIEVGILNIQGTTITNAVFPDGGTISGNGNIFGKVYAFGNYMNLGGTQNFDSLILNVNPEMSVPFGQTVLFNDTQNVHNYFYADGICSRVTELKNGALNYTPGGNLNFNYMKFTNMKFYGATFTASNSTTSGSVTGITSNPSPGRNLYWVGGTGESLDSLHWSSVSGGPGGQCPPTFIDTVHFDSNSFSAPGDTIKFPNYYNQFATMNFTGANKPLIYGLSATNPFIQVHGSLIIPDTVYVTSIDRFVFKSSNPGNIIDVTGLQYIGPESPVFEFDSISGSWDLQSDVLFDLGLPGGRIYVKNGELNCNGHYLQCTAFTAFTGGKVNMHNTSVLCDYWDTSPGFAVADSTDITCKDYFNGGDNNSFFDVSAADRVDCDTCTFRDVYARELYTRNSNFRNVVLQDTSVTLNGSNNIISKATFTSPKVNMYQNTTYDTLLLNHPGARIKMTGQHTVNDKLFIASDPVNKTYLSGSASFNFGDSLCADYIILKNVAAIGSSFYAGDHSVDSGGNTGWNFTSCVPQLSNVWPGDANYDLIVDNNDLLYIGVAYGDTGFVRPSASISWVAQPCLDWYYTFSNGINEKRADSDGDGQISFQDTTAVSVNYGLTHPLRLGNTKNVTNNFGAEFFLWPPTGFVAGGSQVSVPIVLGTLINPANNTYGISFTINYDPAIVEAGSLYIDFSNSWIENTGNHLSIVKDFHASGKCEVAFTRIDGQNVSGSGIIGMLNFTVPNLSGGILDLNLTGSSAISNSLVAVPLFENAEPMFTGNQEMGEEMFKVYPNPSKDYFNISFQRKGNKNVQLLNVNGVIVFEVSTDQTSLQIDQRNISAGIYFLRVISGGEVLVRKVIFE